LTFDEIKSKNLIKEQLSLEQRLNVTREQKINRDRRATYTRELEILLMRIYADITNLALSLDMATLHKLTASLLPSQKLFAILRDIYVQLDQGYTFITVLKPENVHIFYAASEITALATGEAIHLIIQVPLKTESGTYSFYTPIPLPMFQPNLRWFIQVQVRKQKLAISSDRRSYVIMPDEYIQNCKEGIVRICLGTIPIIDRAFETCLSGLFFETSQGHALCTREIISEGFRPVFRRLPSGNHWLYSVGKPTRVECRCVGVKGCPTNLTMIEGTGILPQHDGCEFYVGQFKLPATRQFESRAEWGRPEIVIPRLPDLLPTTETEYIREHQGMLVNIWDTWKDSQDDPDANPVTMFQLQQQLEARIQGRRWRINGVIIGSTVVVTIVVGLCLWKHGQRILAIKAMFAKSRRTPTRHVAEDTAFGHVCNSVTR
jgi:hypothetical protein